MNTDLVSIVKPIDIKSRPEKLQQKVSVFVPDFKEIPKPIVSKS